MVSILPSLVFLLSKTRGLFDLLIQPICPEYILWARHGIPGNGSARPSRMSTGNQTFFESSAVIKIDRKGDPMSWGSSSFKFHPSGTWEEGQIGQVYLGRPYGVGISVQALELDSLGSAL